MAERGARDAVGGRSVEGLLLLAMLTGACAGAPQDVVGSSPRSAPPRPLVETVRWVHHPPFSASWAPAVRLADGGCLVVAPPGRWLVRPSDSMSRWPSIAGRGAVDAPAPCVGLAEFIPGTVTEHVQRVVMDGQEVFALSVAGTLQRAASPRAPLEVMATPVRLVDIGASHGALFGVADDGRVLTRQGAQWRDVPGAPRDVVELGVLEGDVVARSIPERYTLLLAGGTARAPRT